MLERANSLMASMAGQFLEKVRATSQDWDKAYMRLEVSSGHNGFEASIVKAGEATLFGGKLLDSVADTGVELWDELQKAGHPFKLLLLTVSSDGGYEIDFENRKVNRWQIRLDEGYDGIPR